MKVVMVHGIGQGGQDAVQLQRAWRGAIEQGFADSNIELPTDIEFLFPFYGDILDSYVKDAERANAAEKGGVVADTGYEEFAREFANAAMKKLPLTDAMIALELGDGKADLVGEKGPGSWNWVQAVLRVADRYLSHTTRFTMSLFVQESYQYLYNQNAWEEVHEVVQPMLKGERPAVVIGHSLGSAVTYRCLRDLNIQPDLYLTIGSPLGTKYFVRQLAPIANPVPNAHWWNGYDERDVVALNPLTPPDFDFSPGIVNDNSLKNSSDNHHSSLRYLSSSEVSQVLSTVLR